MIFRRKQTDMAPATATPEVDAYMLLDDVVLSQETVVVLARLQGLADRLETAVTRLEGQE